MSIQIELDLKEILQELKDGQKKIIEKVEAIDKRLTKVETKLDNAVDDIKELKTSQKAQIWTLIGILFTAVAGLLVAIGKFVLSGNGI